MDDSIMNLIKRQTNYNETQIIEKMKEHNNNIEKIILEYNGVSSNDSKNEKEITTNQKIFKAIRDNMNELSSSRNAQSTNTSQK
tara:strand:- start:163 stop:414 length:252 start_codon:yes stop_codon:yes gene_type:complete